ncbi:MAG TPA: phosphoadenylyl-sulfate reductase [Bacteroidia bacterium]|jgi:phosphoadenosine phosphosulfate reductase|nr:phosphoadenylyl-sulfate reductase [Bacteroidia bacterium]
MQKINDIRNLISGKTEVEALHVLAETFPGKVVFSTSLGYEDQVITHLIYSNNLAVKIFTLETGRLFKETSDLITETHLFYKKEIEIFYPEQSTIEKLVSEKGLYSFYDSVENRKECCHIRKVESLKRALTGNEIWITGIRAEQSGVRKEMPQVEWDETNQIIKFHPILSWSFEEVKNFINLHKIPYNPLHDKGYMSIGCEPCTRAIKPGEDFRAGRWWWENSSAKECGLHENKK